MKLISKLFEEDIDGVWSKETKENLILSNL